MSIKDGLHSVARPLLQIVEVKRAFVSLHIETTQRSLCTFLFLLLTPRISAKIFSFFHHLVEAVMDLETVVSSPETPELLKIPINEPLNVLYIISLVNPGTYVRRLSVFLLLLSRAER